MKKTGLIAICTALIAALSVGLTACGGTGASVYNVATTLGYEGSETGWIASVTDSGTQARKMYEEAKADGFTGTYVEFLKEIGYTQNDGSASVSNAVMSVVAIKSGFAESEYTYVNGRPSYQEKTTYSAGSGVIYSIDREEGDAYIITNYHVVYDVDSTGKEETAHISDDISVYLYGSVYGGATGAIPADYVGGSMEYDIAVLRVEDNDLIKNSYALPLKAANSDAVTAGETVYAIGNAEGKGISVSQGVVSVEAEYIPMLAADEATQVSRLEIRTDAAVNHGNSGGGLFNADGSLVGIVNARSEESGVTAFGYAIPSNLALAIAQNVIDNSKTNNSKGAFRAMLGVTLQVSESHSVYNEETQRAYIVETVTVRSVALASASFGKLKEDDIIYSIGINGGTAQVITRQYMAASILFNVRFGDTVEITVYRGGEIKQVSVSFDQNSYFNLYN